MGLGPSDRDGRSFVLYLVGWVTAGAAAALLILFVLRILVDSL